MYDFDGPLVPTIISKRQETFGQGSAVGRRSSEVSKGVMTPIAPKGPSMKAPTLARTGGTGPNKGRKSTGKLMLAQVADPTDLLKLGAVGKADRRVKGALYGVAAGSGTAAGVGAGYGVSALRQVKRAGSWQSSKGDTARFARGGAKLVARSRPGLALAGAGAVAGAAAGQRRKVHKGLVEISKASSAQRKRKLVQVKAHNSGADRLPPKLPPKPTGALARIARVEDTAPQAAAKASRFGMKSKIGIGAASAGALGALGAHRSKASKAYRSYSAEDKRQRRLGAAAAGSAIGGGLLTRSGATEITRDTGGMRRAVGELKQAGMQEGAGKSQYGRAVQRGGKIAAEKAALVRAKPAGKVGAGLGLLGVSAKLMAEHHQKRWQ